MVPDDHAPRLLFVDDEAPVLEGIRNALRRDRKRWDMAFAVGADAALAELESRDFDVVVSDMKMPGMDGAALLERTRQVRPLALRLVLSGHADRAEMVRSRGVAHHFLTKPCEPVVLRGMLERAADLSRYVRSAAILELLQRIGPLPSTPEPIWPSAANGPGAPRTAPGSFTGDPAFAERLMRMSQQVFRMGEGTREGGRLLTTLGEDIAASLYACAQIHTRFASLGVPDELLERVQAHSLLTAWLAATMLDDPTDARIAFSAGLLHDVGLLALALDPTLPPPRGGLPDDDADEERSGVAHSELGAHLAAAWSLPLGMMEAIAHHHRPPPLAGTFSVSWAVHLADALVHEAAGGKSSVLSLADTQRTSAAFMSDLGGRLAAARRELLGQQATRTGGRRP